MSIAPTIRIVAVACACVLALIGLVVYEGRARAEGAEIILRMEAVDPRALLSGHYVIVGLQEALAPGGVCPPGVLDSAPPELAPERWIALSANGDHHSAVASAATRAEAARPGAVLVRGQLTCMPPRPSGGDDPGFPGAVRLDIGVERFHIDQTQAQRIERILRAQTPGAEARVSAIVSVGSDGRARLKGLLIDGARLELSWM